MDLNRQTYIGLFPVDLEHPLDWSDIHIVGEVLWLYNKNYMYDDVCCVGVEVEIGLGWVLSYYIADACILAT